MRTYFYFQIFICALLGSAYGAYAGTQTTTVSGYVSASCTTTRVIRTALSLGDWLDEGSRVKSGHSVNSPVANVQCSTPAYVSVIKRGGKLALQDTADCDYSGAAAGIATCVKYTADVMWNSVHAISPYDDMTPGSVHNSDVLSTVMGNYTAWITLTPSQDPANPQMTPGLYSDVITVNVGNQL